MIFVAYGANLPSLIGSPAETYAKIPEYLARYGVLVLAAARLRMTAPVPASDQPDYANGMFSVQTDMGAESLLVNLMRIENELGRVRGEKNAARGVDLDLIAYHDCVFEGGGLVIPHPRMHERRFVLEPLAEIAPNWVHPVLGKSAEDMLKTLV